MKTTSIKYGLLHIPSNKIVGYCEESNSGGDFCGDIKYTLSLNEENMWLVDDEIIAAWVKTHDTHWYNAGFETPVNKLEADELKVVKVTQTQTIETEESEFTLPDDMELFRLKYEKKEPGHLEYLKTQKDIRMDLYGTLELRREKKI
jgi:hypothetical protein